MKRRYLISAIILFIVLSRDTFAQNRDFLSSKLHIDIDQLNKSILKADTNISNNLDYFIQESNSFKRFNINKNGKSFDIERDNLFPYLKEMVTDNINHGKFEKNNDPIWIKNSASLSVYRKMKLLEMNSKKRDTTKNRLFQKYINSLPPSIEKAILTYQIDAILDMQDSPYSFQVFEKVNKIAENISDLSERSHVYQYLGDLQSDDQEYAIAISNYFLARECISNSGISNKQKEDAEGFYCEKIAWIFSNYKTRESQDKMYSYYSEATEHYKKSKNSKDLLRVLTYMFSNYSLLNNSYFETLPDVRIRFRKALSATLIFLKPWLSGLDKNQFKDEISSYYFFSIIANVFVLENKPSNALQFYLRALISSQTGNDLRNVSAALQSIGYIYGKIGNSTLATNYSDLAISINSKQGDAFYYDSYLERAEIQGMLKNYSSALKSLNNVLYDTSIRYKLLPAYVRQILKRASWDKFLILDSLGLDSAYIYKDYYNGYLLQEIDFFSSIVNSELYSINSWLERSKNREREQNEIIKSTLIKEKKLSDSLRLKDSLLSIIQLSKEKQETENQKETVQKEKEKALQQAKVNKEQRLFYFSIISALICLAVIFFLVVRNRNLNRRRKVEIQNIQLNELAKSKIHNLRSDITDIDILVRSNSPLATVYMEAYKKFLKIFLHNWGEEKITLKGELDELRSYHTVKSVLKKIDLIEKIDIKNPDEIYFIQSVFDTLLDNSVKHGFSTKSDNCIFTIHIYKDEDYLICEITDNGIPTPFIVREKSGLNILKKRVLDFYETMSRKCPPDYFCINSLPDNIGTYVKLILPYAKA